MRLIDADTLRAARYHALPYTHIHALGADVESYERGWNDALDAAAESAPTVDAVEVVRCENCKFFEDEDEDGDCWCYCHNDITRRDGYCSWGKGRKDD